MCILVGNDPRAYREVLSAALRELRPQMDIITVEPYELDGATMSLSPDLVVCSALSEIVETRPRAWVLLYPQGAGKVVVSVTGNRLEMDGLEFPRLLSVIDEAESAVRST